MSLQVYVDTNVLMDFLLSRRSSSSTFLMNAVACKYSLILSDVVLAELDYNGLSGEAERLCAFFEKQRKLCLLHSTAQDRANASAIVQSESTSFNDALHGVMAERSDAQLLLTSNTKDFKHITQIRVVRPDDI